MGFFERAAALVPARVLMRMRRLSWRHPRLKRMVGILAQSLRGRDGTIQRGIGQGLRFNIGASEASFLLGVSKPHLQHALQQALRPNQIFYDIGANVGFFSLIGARLVGDEGRVIAFEPLPANAEMIERNAAANAFMNIAVMRFALGRQDGEARFMLSERPTWGKLAEIGTKPDRYCGEIVVPIRKLDSVVESARLAPPDVIKIDVEGAEIDVLSGARMTIAASRPVFLIELHGTNVAVERILSDYGYVTTVLGTTDTVADAHWNCHVLALPNEKKSALLEAAQA
ncbi:MAG: FkbM family methyltransferase [Candidatus Binataceae bacterium]